MIAGQRDGQLVRDEVERVISSACFGRSERVSKLLRFLVERQLEGRENELKESVIGVEVFGRKPDYDPKVDSTVRTEAARLRARLTKYYSTEGSQDAIVIDLPKGGYVPSFRRPEAVRNVPVQRSGPKRLWFTAALAGVALTAAAIGGWWVLHKNTPIPIVVLPLTNLSQDRANDYFADGLTDEIIRNLSIIDGLAVRSRTSSFAFKGKSPNVREAGKQLGADYILAGSVLHEGQKLRINAQLIRVRDDLPLWSAKFDRELTDVFAIQDEIARGIVNSLRLKLGRGRRRYETSAEAYDLYLRARALPIHSGLRGYDESIAPFEGAIAKDPSFAPAYAGLAAAHAFRSGQFRFDLADESSKMRAAAEKAIQLDPLLAEAHDALGMAYAHDAQWAQSEKSFLRALELDHSRSSSYGHYATFLLWPLGRIDEALEQLRLAERAEPLSPTVQHWLSNVLISAGQYDEAAGHCQKLPAEFSVKHECLGRVWLGQGRTGEAIQLLATSNFRYYLGYAYARAGRTEDAERIATDLVQRPFQQAVVFAGLGDKDRTLEALDRSAVLGPFRMGRALHDPEFELVRGDPRVNALRNKVGLP